jgi:hypothetical protein
MNGVEYYRDRRVDRSQYKGLSFRLRDGVLELARLRGPAPRAVSLSGAAARPRGPLHPAVECRQDGYSSCVRPVRSPPSASNLQRLCNDGMAHAQSGIRTKQTLAVECRPGLQTQP